MGCFLCNTKVLKSSKILLRNTGFYVALSEKHVHQESFPYE